MGHHGKWAVAHAAILFVSSMVSARRILESAVFSEFAGIKNSSSSRLLKKHDHFTPPV